MRLANWPRAAIFGVVLMNLRCRSMTPEVAQMSRRAVATVCLVAISMTFAPNCGFARSWRWMVFFDSQSAELKEHALSQIKEFVDLKSGNCPLEVRLSGHMDAEEALTSPNTIDIERGQAVASQFKRLGTPAWTFKIVGNANSCPLVPTKPGVPEPQNRMVRLNFEDVVQGNMECGPPVPPGFEGILIRDCWVVLPNGTRCYQGA